MAWIFAVILTLLQVLDGLVLFRLASRGVNTRIIMELVSHKLGILAGTLVIKLCVTGGVWFIAFCQPGHPALLVLLYLLTVIYVAIIFNDLARLRFS